MERLVLWHRLVPEGRGDPNREVGAAWTGRVSERLRFIGGTVVAAVGSSVVVEFDPLDLRTALDSALAVLTEARAEEPPIKASFGVACGELVDADAPYVGPIRRGAALDRAQLLANRAHPGEVVLDPKARDLAAPTYLFRRLVRAGTGSMRGHAVDPVHSRRDLCRPAIRFLGRAPIPPATAEALAPVRELAAAEGRHRVVLRGPIGAGAREWTDALERELDPPLVLRIGAVPGSLEPLGSLRFSLLRRWGSAAEVGNAAVGDHGDTLGRIASGHAIDRSKACDALAELLATHGLLGRPWLILDPLAGIDPATIEVIGEVTADGPDALLIARLPLDARVPTPLRNTGEPEEFRLPVLRAPDARNIAEAVLGPDTSADITRRIAVLGGETPFGVIEAARTLIASGDLVRENGRFVWRLGARSGVSSIPIEMLLEERLTTLEPTPLRILEAICAAPSGTPADVLLKVMSADGLSRIAIEEGIEQLRDEALLRRDDPWQATSNVLRTVVTQSMAPSRANELYQFVADTMNEQADSRAEFARATIGYFLAECGHEDQGARALLEAGRAAALSDFSRSAVRLAASAVQFDPSREIRRAASHLSRVSTARRSAGSEMPPPPSDTQVGTQPGTRVGAGGGGNDLRVEVVGALAARDFENVDRLIDMAIAEGYDRAAADRMRAVAYLLRGDAPRARDWLAESRGYPQDEIAKERTLLATALVGLIHGDPGTAARTVLRTLAAAKRRGDAQGRRAALHALAICCDAAGRDAAAASLRIAPN